MRIPYPLTDQEIELAKVSKDDPNIWLKYWFKPYGDEPAFQLDRNMNPGWQREVCLASQSNIIVSGGVGSGKTVGVGIMASYFAGMVYPDFKFLNAAPFSYQAGQMHAEILKQAANTPFEKLIWATRFKPYPNIVLKFAIGKTIITSTMEFMSVDKNAKNIFSYEGDWINIEEGGLLDNLEEVMISLGTRLRGSYRGRARMGRLSIISNPWDNPHFWYIFDMAQADPENYLSMTVSTRGNKNVTDKQLELILKRIPPEEHERFINGARPEGSGNFFNRLKVYECENPVSADWIQEQVTNKKEGYGLQRDPHVGVAYFEVPRIPKHQYMIFGDLGTDKAPDRNAPALMVFDVSGFPEEPAEMVGFWWGNGNGSIMPFFKQLLRFSQKFQPLAVGVDSTGTQKYSAEMMNTFILTGNLEWTGLFSANDDKVGSYGLPKDFKVSGMDFSGTKKVAYLRSGAFLIEAVLFRWPRFLTGLRSQLANYDPLRDKNNEKGIPQDLVATLCMAAYAIRRYFYLDLPEEEAQKEARDADSRQRQATFSTLRASVHARSQRSASRRPQTDR